MARLKHTHRRSAHDPRSELRRRWNRSLLLGSTGLGGVLAGLALGAGSAWAQVAPNTLPSGGQVVAGSATINQANPSTLNINQTTNRAIINWNSFDVGSNASVNFYQPNSGAWTLNRVNGSIAPSQILGHITANGNIAVINPNGVIFGAGSRVDVNGLIATTANITDQNFMNGNMKFDQAGNPTATVQNFGDITVKDAGLVAFVAPGVSNAGTINARLGTVSLAAGQRFTIDLYGDKLVSIAMDGEVDQRPVGPDGKPLDALVDNSGKIVADGGHVQLTAKQARGIVDTAINMNGVVQAQSAYVAQNGDIVLDGGPAGDVKVGGTIDATGKNAGTKGGNVTITGKDNVQIAGGARIDASGDAGGGKIKIGGDYQGKGSTPTAKRTVVATGAQIKADATRTGNGGVIIVWSDDNTMVGGVLSVMGGLVSGNGGLIETSSKGVLTVVGSTDVRLNAPNGIGGEWLLDPQNITVTSPSAGTLNGNDGFGDAGTNNTISAATIVSGLSGGGTVNLQATNDITVSEAITSATGSLVLRAGRDININAAITLSGGSFSATANDSGAGTNFPGGGVVAGGSVGRLDSTSGDISITSAISATSISLTVTNSTAAITFGSPPGSGGTLNYNPGSITIGAPLTATGASGNVAIAAASASSHVTVNALVQAKNNITLNVGGNATLSNNLTADSDSAGGGTLSGTASHVYVTNNTAQVADAVLVVNANGTVHLAGATTWNELITINKGLTLQGAAGSVLNGSAGSGSVITVNAAGGAVVIDSLGVVGNNSNSAIVLVSASSAFTFRNGSVTGAGLGNTANGIQTTSSNTAVTVSGSTIGNTGGTGLLIDPVFGPVAVNNTVTGVGGAGIEVTGATGSITVVGNTVNASGSHGIYLHDNTGTVGNVASVTGNTVGNDNAAGNIGGHGIFVDNTTGTFAGAVSIIGNYVGADTDGAGGATAANMGGSGIALFQATAALQPVRIFGNTIGAADNTITGSGITLNGTHATGTIGGNVISVAGDGIFLNNTIGAFDIAGNTVNNRGASGHGIHVQRADGLTVEGNVLTGLSIPGPNSGIYIDDPSTTIVNPIIRNNVIRNYTLYGISVGFVDGTGMDGIIAGNDIAGVNTAIHYRSAGGYVSISGNTINGAVNGIQALSFGGQVSVSGNTLGNDAALGTIDRAIFASGGDTVYIGGNRIGVDTDGPGGNNAAVINTMAIEVFGHTPNVSIFGNSIANAAGGILVSNNNNSDIVDIAGNTIAINGALPTVYRAISVSAVDAAVSIHGNSISGAAPMGVLVNNVATITNISGNTISGTAGRGINVQDVSAGGVTISDNVISNGTDSAIVLRNTIAGNVLISGNSVSNVLGAGVAVDATVTGNALVDANVVAAVSNGVVVSQPVLGNLTVSNNTATGISQYGVQVRNDNAGGPIEISGNILTGTGAANAGYGIFIDSGAGTLTNGVVISSNVVSSFRNGGILVDPVFGPTVIGNDVFNIIAGNGIEVAAPVGSVTILSNTVNGIAGHAIYVHDASGTAANVITIAGNTVDNDGSSGGITGGAIVGANNGGFLGAIDVNNNRIGVDTDGGGPNTPGPIAGAGIVFANSGGAIGIAGNTVVAPGAQGIRVDTAAGVVDIGDNTVINSNNGMIEVVAGSGGVSVHDNTATGSLDHGVAVFNSSTVAISDNTISTSQEPILVQQVNAGGLTIDGNTVYGGGGNAILVQGNVNGGATVLANSIGGFNGTGVWIQGGISGDLSVNDNLIDNVFVGIQATASVSGNVLVDNNTIDNVRSGDAIKLANVGGTIHVTNNRLASFLADSTISGNGISIDGVPSGGAITIAGNRIADNAGMGGIVSIFSDGILVTNPANVLVISGNTIGDADTRVASSGIELSGGSALSDVTIAGNTIVNYGNGGIGAAGLKMTGFPSPGTVRVFGNLIRDGVGDGIRFLGVGQSTIGGTGALGNTIDGIVGAGISIDNYTQTTVSGNLVGTSGTISGSGVSITNGTNVDVEGNRIGNDSTGTVVVIGGDGIAVSGFFNATISGNTVGGGATNDSRIGGTGIVLSGGNLATVSNNVVRNTGYSDVNADGIRFSPGGTISATGNSVFNVANNGIELGSLTGQYVSGNTVDGNHDARGGLGGSGIQVNGGLFVSATGNTIADVAQAGISVAGLGNATIGLSGAGNTISNADGHGVRLIGVGSSTVSANTIGTTPTGVEIFGGGPMLIERNSISVSGMFSAGVTVGGTGAPVQVLFNDIVGGSAGNGIYTGDGNFTIQNNNVTGFDTGLRIAIGTAVVTSANSVFDNNFSGNTLGVVHDGTGVVQASGNYWGFASDSGGFTTYFFTGGSTIGTNSGAIDVTPFLKDGTDGNGAAVGFVGNFRNLFVTDLGVELIGGAIFPSGRVQEAVNLIPAGAGTNSIELAVGTFLDNVTINRADITNLNLYGQGPGFTTISAANPALAVITVTALNTGAPHDLTLAHFDVTGTTDADGIAVSNVSNVFVNDVHAFALGNATGFSFAGGSNIELNGVSVGPGVRDGIVMTGASNATVTGATIGANRDGIVLTSVSGATIGNNTSIAGGSRDGIRVFDSTGVNIGNGVSINGVGRDGIRVESDGPASSASIGGVTIVNADVNGVNVVAGAIGTASVAFIGGTSISNTQPSPDAFNAVRASGAGASFSLPTPDGTTDLSLNINASDALQNYFLLAGGAMDNTVTLGYDVNFIGLTGLGSLQTFGLTAATLTAPQIAALFQIEDHMVHEIDNANLGLIRLVPDALFPTATGGLNGVRNAILASSNAPAAQDTVFLQAGDYADPSNQVGGGLVIDRNIRLIGAQAGVSANGGARNPTNAATESILDFGGATSPANGIRITDPSGGAGVLIDGVVVQVDAGQAYGIRIDTNAARDNISILNTFVRGSAGNLGTGNGIETGGGTSTVSHLTITNDVVEYFAGDGIHLDRTDAPLLQNNFVRNIDGNGIFLDRSGGVVVLSGNTVETAGLDAIFVDRSGGTLSVAGNTIRGTANDGIVIDRSGAGVAVLNNEIAGGSGAVVHGDGIRISRTQGGGVTVSGNRIATGANSATDLRGIFINGVSAGGVTIANNTLASGSGAVIGAAVGVTVSPNDPVNGAAGDAIFLRNVAGSATIDANSIATGDNARVAGRAIGMWAVSGNALIDGNVIASGSLSSIGATGVEVFDTGGALTVAGNTLASGFGATVDQAGFTSGDGIDIGTVGGDIVVSGNRLFTGEGSGGDGAGIHVFDGGANVSVVGNTIAGGSLATVGFYGLTVEKVVGSATIANNSVAGGAGATIDGNGIFADNIDGSLTIASNVVAGGDGASLSGSGIFVADISGSATLSGNAILGGANAGLNGYGIFADRVDAVLVIDGNTIADGAGAHVSFSDAIFADRSGSLIISNNRIAGGAGAAVGSYGIFVDRTAGSVSATGNSIGLGGGASIGIDGIHVEDTANGGVTVSANQVHNTGNSGIAVLRTDNGSVTISNNALVNLGGHGIEVANTGTASSGNVFVLSNSIDTAGGDGVFVDPTIGDVTVNGQNILNVAGNGIRVFRTTGKVVVGADLATGNTINGTGRFGILVDQTGQIPGPITGSGGVTVSGNTLGNLAGSTIGATGNFDAIQVSDTFRGDVVVSVNRIAEGANSVVTRYGVHVVDTHGDGLSGGNVTVQGNTVAAGNSATIGNSAVFVDGTVLGAVFVSANRIALGTGAVVNGDGVEVDNTQGVSVVGNTIAGGSNSTIGGNGVSIGGSGNAQVLVQSNQIGIGGNTSIAGNGVLITDTHDGSVNVLSNSIATGAGATIGVDGIRVANTSDGASVTVSSNTIGNATGLVMRDGIRIVDTFSGGVLADANRIQHVGGIGIKIDTTLLPVVVGEPGLGNTIDFTGSDGVRVSNSFNGVTVSSNRIGAANGSTIAGDGIAVVDTSGGGVSVVDNTVGGVGAVLQGNGVFANNNSGGVTVSGNSINTGASGELLGDGVHVDHTGTGSVYVLSNSIGNLNIQRDGDGIDVANTSLGGVTVTGNAIVDFGGFGIHVAQTYGQVVVGGGVGSGNTVNAVDLDAIRINDTGVNGGPGGVLAAGNEISTFSTVFSSGIVVLDTAAGNVTVASNRIGTGTGRVVGDGIRVLDTSLGGVTVADNVLGNNATTNAIGQDGIQISRTGLGVVLDGNSLTNIGFGSGAGRGIAVNVTGLSGNGDTSIVNNTVAGAASVGILAQSIGGNVLASVGSVGNAGDTGMRIDVASDVTVSGFTIAGSGNHGLHLRNVANATVSGVTISNSANDGLRLSRTDDTRPSMTVSVSGVTIDGAGAAGLRLFDNDGTLGGGTIALQVGSGISINGAATGLVVDGPDTRNIGNTLNDLKFSNIGGGTGNYIVLQNAGWYENDGTPNGAFNPTQIDATNVSFDGVIAGSLNPAGNPADVTTLANLELRIVHFLDDATLGLIRIQANSITLPTVNGLNGIQLADYASANGDTIYLVAGTYGDPSDLVPGGLIIDKQITLLGWQHGVSAKNGGRDGVTGESILDFAGATIAPTAGIVIKESNVTIDGVVVLLDGSATGGGIVVDTSVARSNIAIVNNFVHGTSLAFAGGAGIATNGSDTVTGLNISDNVVEFVNGHAITIDQARNLVIQNNQIGNATFGANSVLSSGILVSNSSFAAPVSGNMLNWVAGDGIALTNVLGNVAVDSNSLIDIGGFGIQVATAGDVTINGNTLSTIGTNGIRATFVGNTTIDGNTLDHVGGIGIQAQNAADVRIDDNRLASIGNIGIAATQTANVTVGGNTLSTIAGNGIQATNVANVTIADNALDNVTGSGIVVQTAADVRVIDNALSTIGSLGIFTQFAGGVTASGNTLSSIGNSGIVAMNVGNTTVDTNTLDNVVGNGIQVQFAGQVQANGNTLSTIGNNGIATFVTGDTTIDSNRLDSISSNGIAVQIAGQVQANGNTVSGTGAGGMLVLGAGNTTVDNNRLDHIGTNGIVVQQAAQVWIDGNTLSTIGGVGISASTVANTTIDNNQLDHIGDNGIVVFLAGDVAIDGNTLSTVGASGITAFTVGSTTIDNNRLDHIGDNGIQVSVAGAVRANANTLSSIGTNGILVLTSGDVTVNDNTLSAITNHGIRVNQAGNVTIDGNTLGQVGGIGISALNAGDVRIDDNRLTSIGNLGIAAAQVGNVTMDGNTLSTIANTGIQATNVANVTISDNALDHVGGSGILTMFSGDVHIVGNQLSAISSFGIYTQFANNVSVNGNTLSSITSAGISALNVGNTTIDNNRLDRIGGNGIFVQVADAVSINGNTLSTIGGHGIAVFDVPSAVVSNDTVFNVNGDGLHLERTDDTRPSMTVSVSGVTIDGAGAAGLRLFDNDGTVGGGTIALQVGSGISIANAATGLVVDGPDTRNIGNTLNDLKFSNIGGGTGNYIVLQNAGWYEDDAIPNGPFNPTQIDATQVSFDGVIAGSLDPANNPADVTTLANLELRIVHFLDDATLGLIRIQANSITLPTANGLNGIQLADYASANGDTIYLVAGTYGDPSDLVPGGLIIDKQITLLGWQHGVSAKNGGRDGVTGESILDFAGATIAPTAGIVIRESNVTIDGVVVLLNGTQTGAGIGIDSSVDRSNINIVNNFVHGTSLAFAGGDGIATTGGGTVTNLNVSDNAVEFVTGDAIEIVQGRNLTIQNNVVGNATFGANNVLGHGIAIYNSSFATPVSGNVVNWVAGGGIGAAGVIGGIAVTDNSLAHIGGSGIVVQNGADVTISGNTMSTLGIFGIYALNVANTTIGNNTIDHVNSNGILVNTAATVDVSGNSLSTIGGNGISAVNVGNTTIADNALDNVVGHGIFVQNGSALDVSGNTMSTVGIFGIAAVNVGDTTIANNTLDHVSFNGIFVQGGGTLDVSGNVLSTVGGYGISALGVGNTTIDNNSLDHIDGTGIFVQVADAVSIGGNTLSTVALTNGHGIALFDVASAVVSNDTVFNVNGDGLHLERTDDTRPSMTVSVSGVTIDGSSGAGIRLFDNDGTVGGGTIALQVGSGISIANAATGLVVDGPDTRNIGNTLNDLKFSNIGGGTGNYIVLQNAGWYENDGTPNGAFNPTQIDATNVSFDGVIAGSLNPAGNPADVTTLANLELRIVHFLDDATLGLIRIQANSITLPTANGLNGIQLADYASANGDSIYLVAGTYGDPSDLVPGGLIIDKQISLLGWQHGVSAKNGGRDGVTGESILDFAGATIAPTAGIVIRESNVAIDGVVVLLDGSATGGGIVVDTSVARANVAIVNNFVHGTSGVFANSPGIVTQGSETITGLNISDNVVEYVNGDGIAIANGVNVTIQNNLIGNTFPGTTTVNGDGIRATNTSFGAAVSGNTIVRVLNDGIELSGSGDVTVSDNSIANAATGNGITITGYDNARVAANSIANVQLNGIFVDIAGSIVVVDNGISVTNAGVGIGVTNGATIDIEGNFVTAAALEGIVATSVGGVTIASNSVAGAGADGVRVQYAGGVSILSNSVSGSVLDGIAAISVAGVTVGQNTIGSASGNGIRIDTATDTRVLDNQLTYITLDGIQLRNAGPATVSGNTMAYISGDGIDVANGQALTIANNGISYVAGNAIIVDTVDDLTISGNAAGQIGGAGITVFNAGDASINGNLINYVNGGDGIAAVSVGNVTVANNEVLYVSFTGITIGNAGDVLVLSNTVSYAQGHAIAVNSAGAATIDDNYSSYAGMTGVTVTNADSTSIDGNTILATGGDGIHAANINGPLSILGNTVGNSGADGIAVSTVFGDVTVSDNRLSLVTATGITISNTGNVFANGNTLFLVAGDGIVISTATSNATVQDNSLSQIGGNGIIVGQLTDATITGNVLSTIAGTGIAAAQINNATVSGNSLGDVGGDGINLSQANDLVVDANRITRISGDGIDIAQVADVTISGNILNDTGQAAGAGVRLDSYTMATIVGNSIVNLTAATGMAIANGAPVPFPQGNTTIAGNLLTGSQVGLQTSGDVLGTISGNTITNNSQWGIIVGTGITQTHPDQGYTYLNLLVTGNLIANNGVPGDHTLVTGGVRNDNIGLVLDARGNDWGSSSGPFASPTHFNRPNPSGQGNAVSDWVQYADLTIVVPPIVPPVRPLLDNFARGPHVLTPGDLLAIGPSFTANGILFDPYFVGPFETPFGLGQAALGDPATTYANCYLGDMWQTNNACQLPPKSQP